MLAEKCGLLSTLKNMISFPVWRQYEYATLDQNNIYIATIDTPLSLFKNMIHRYTTIDRKLLGDFAPILYVWLRDTKLKNMLIKFWFNQLDEVVNIRHITQYIACFDSWVRHIGYSGSVSIITFKNVGALTIWDINGKLIRLTSYCDSMSLLIKYLLSTYGQTGQCQNIFRYVMLRTTTIEKIESLMWNCLPDVLAHSLPIELRKIVGEYLDYPQQEKQ
jgi:hypothetical protein